MRKESVVVVQELQQGLNCKKSPKTTTRAFYAQIIIKEKLENNLTEGLTSKVHVSSYRTLS